MIGSAHPSGLRTTEKEKLIKLLISFILKRSNPSKTSSVLARGRGTTLSFSLENMETVSAIAEIIRYKQPTLEQEEIDSTARSCTSAYCRVLPLLPLLSLFLSLRCYSFSKLNINFFLT